MVFEKNRTAQIQICRSFAVVVFFQVVFGPCGEDFLGIGEGKITDQPAVGRHVDGVEKTYALIRLALLKEYKALQAQFEGLYDLIEYCRIMGTFR